MFDPNPIDVRPLPNAADTADWTGFAWLMGIPKDYRECFISWLRRSVRSTWWLMVDVDRECRRMAALEAHRLPAKAACRRHYAAEVAKAGRAFLRALETRSAPSDREMAKTVSKYLQEVRAPRRGAPKRDDHFADFLERLLVVTCGFGGSVTFNRKTGKGNIVDLLNELRPIAPEGFVPKALPMSTIERLAAKTRSTMTDRDMVENVPRILAQLGEISSKHEEEDERERVEMALVHEEILAEEIGHVCPDCGQPRLDPASLARLSQVSGIPVEQLLAGDIGQDESDVSTPDRSEAVLKVITGGLSRPSESGPQ